MLDGLPLEGCGCTAPAGGDDPSAIRQLGRIECMCQDRLGQSVAHVIAGECGDDRCEPKRSEGDWVASPEGGAGTVPCVPRGNGQVRAYVGSNNRGNVAVLDVSGGQALRGGAAKKILDANRTIPGVTAIFVDDLMSDLEADPAGRFVFTVNSSSGTLSILASDAELTPAVNIDLGRGPLFSADVLAGGLESQPATVTGRPRMSTPTAWITAPIAREVLEIDLDAIAQILKGEENGRDVIKRCFALSDDSNCEGRLLPTSGQRPGRPGHVAVSWSKQALIVGHATSPQVTVFDLSGENDAQQFSLSRSGACPDGYLANTVSVTDDPSCKDGIDNDEDGDVDDDDDDCILINSEARNPQCPQLVPCADGVDNDQDGLIDALDLNCQVPQPYWEGPIPACADGRDNDGDGLIDRADPGCSRESDVDEGDLERGVACDNGEDDDSDGLIDEADPGCSDPEAAARYAQEREPECGDGIDNDQDGRIDFKDNDGDGQPDQGSDPDCFAAGDKSEGASAIETGPTALQAVQAPFPSGDRHFVYALDGRGAILVLDLDEEVPKFYRTRMTSAVLSWSVRRLAHAVSMLVVTADKALRQVFIGVPETIRTHTGADTFARYPALKTTSAETWTRLLDSYGPVVDDFYSVIDGGAYRVERMDDLCRLPSCAENTGMDDEQATETTECDDGTICLDGLCTPEACDEDAPCSEGQVCILGSCMIACVTTADCRPAEACGVNPMDVDTGKHCRSRCRLNEQGALLVDTDASPLAASGAYGSDALDATAIEPGSSGLVDPIVLRDNSVRIWHGEQNAYVNAKQRTAMISGAPDFTVATTSPTPIPERYAVFCQLHQSPQPLDGAGQDELDQSPPREGDDVSDGPTGCVPVGYVEDENGQLREKTADELEASHWHRVDNYAGIQMRETRPGKITAETHRLSFEGELPNSLSRTGVFELSPVEGQWNLVDYNSNYCELGVEEGDVVLFDRFIPAVANRQACAVFDLRTQTGPIDQRLEPLRYVVKAVGPYRLVLEADTRTRYGQVPKNDYALPPRPASPPPIPSPECVSQLLTYRVRVGHDQWLLEGALTGFRHPWVRQGAQCIRSDTRLNRKGRARLGELFENEWFRFKIGHHAASLDCESLEASDTCLPYMLDSRYEFGVQPGTLFQRKLEVAGVPKEMRWLPNDDRLYIVDEQFRTVIELLGFDIFQGAPIEVRRFR
ncbi:MAG: hypothetical protein VX589_01470 [Myxococcota bacterium]|nr:hypothetical protein [Myxococcota bacterium]